jgi:hypothetical protein
MKYRKKPIVVEAEQWFPGKYVRGVTEAAYNVEDGKARLSGYGHVVTIHGEHAKVVPGDWVITEPDGEHHYPCKPDIFEATYEPVKEEEQGNE